MTRILIVEDDDALRRALSINLRSHGYDISAAADGRSALALAASDHPDAVVLDLGLPDIDGTEVIRGLRGWTTLPIIVLSARQTSQEKVWALDEGADDYVTKPFGMDELLARIRVAVRRYVPASETALIETPHFTVDLTAKRVSRDGADVRLTPTEWAILELLVRHPGQLMPQRQILAHVWGPAYEKETNYLRVYVAHLRRKLEPVPSAPRYIVTESGMGYRFEP